MINSCNSKCYLKGSKSELNSDFSCACFPREVFNPEGVSKQHINKYTYPRCPSAVQGRHLKDMCKHICFHSLDNSLLICQGSAAFHTNITAVFSDLKYALFLEEFQVRDVVLEKIYDLIISFIFLMDFHASPLPTHGLFIFILIAIGCALRGVQICNRASLS